MSTSADAGERVQGVPPDGHAGLLEIASYLLIGGSGLRFLSGTPGVESLRAAVTLVALGLVTLLALEWIRSRRYVALARLDARERSGGADDLRPGGS